ncbi:MAG: VOC family protein, partial [Acidobacteriota bacterium]
SGADGDAVVFPPLDQLTAENVAIPFERPFERWEDDGVTIGAALSYGDVTLGLSQDDFQKGRDRQKGVGFRILLETNEDIDTLATGIQERGGALVSPPRNQDWGTREFAVADPDGFKITITSPMPSE